MKVLKGRIVRFQQSYLTVAGLLTEARFFGFFTPSFHRPLGFPIPILQRRCPAGDTNTAVSGIDDSLEGVIVDVNENGVYGDVI